MVKLFSYAPTALGGLLAAAAALVLLAVVSCSDEPTSDATGDSADAADTTPAGNHADARFVGADACMRCHQAEHDHWAGSHHDLAMKEPTEETVLGDFDNASFEHAGATSRFFKKDGKYYVNTDGPDGRNADFEVAYTFGWEPLQQYLIRFPGGRIQSLTIAWDTRPEEAGGQRWFHLYPDETIPHTDALHWTGPNFTWNHMCAECHSTQLEKHYDEGTKTYQTVWQSINVSCEACHGPGKDHADWAERYRDGRADKQGGMGLTVLLKDETRVWDMDPQTGIARRRTLLKDDTLVNACARCHSRRSQIAEGNDAGVAFLDHYRPAHLTEGLYFPDGQIQDEVYVWGSWQQSRMHMAGVTCIDCHDPHTAAVATTTNDLCAACHLPAKFDTPAHHFHEPGSIGASCIDCHMPHRTYMGVDDRRDHSMRVPRPDLSVKLGTPNACTQCHQDQDAQWAADAAVRWWGVDVDRPEHYGEVFADARAGAPGADARLLALLRDVEQPPIVRGTAVLLLGNYPTRRAAEGILEALASDEPLIRVAAADLLGTMPVEARLTPALETLGDPLLAVRIEAGEALADVPPAMINEQDRAKVTAGIEAYKDAQRVSTDTTAAQMNLGSLAYRMGDAAEAEKHYQRVIEIDPTFFPAYANLATIQSQRGETDKALRLLGRGLGVLPGNADLYYARALVHVRARDLAKAMGDFGRAYDAAHGRADIACAYAVALHDTGRAPRAIAVLKKTLETAPNDVQVLIALATYHAELGMPDEALAYARRAHELRPDDPGIARFIAQLGAQRRP